MKRSSLKIFFIGLICILGISAYADKELENRVEQKLAAEEPNKVSDELDLDILDAIARRPDLTQEQRTKIETLRDVTNKKIAELNGYSARVKALLVVDEAAPKYSGTEIDFLKDRLEELEKERTSTLVDALDEVDGILGRNKFDREEVLREIHEKHGPRQQQ